jgi:GNAT acetyltransferase-like protein
VTEVEPSEWDDLLVRLGLADAYYRRSYVEAAAALEHGRPLLLEHEGGVFAAVQREDPPDIVTPYGYGGPVGGDGSFWPTYEEWCCLRGIVTTFISFHPLFQNQVGVPIHVEVRGPTVGWRLNAGRDLLAGMHWKHRNKVRKARKAGVSVTAEHALGAFVSIYEETMRRVQAPQYYFFNDGYWDGLQGLGAGLARFDASIDGEVVASALCLASPPWLHYHLSGTSEVGRSSGASTLLLFEAALWAQEHGYDCFHLGGGIGGKVDSLHHFKERFDPGNAFESAIGKVIHDEEAYRRLSGGHAGFDGYFPAYRMPLDTVAL